MITVNQTEGSPLVAFVGASPSALDAARGRHLSGRVGCAFRKVYAEPLGLPHLVTTISAESGLVDELDPAEVLKALEGVPVVVALGKKARQALGDRADLTLPHPAAVLRRGDSGEVGRKLRAVKRLVDQRARRFELGCEVAKADEDKRLVYGIVLEPNTIDLQGDTLTSETIEQAAHDFLARSRTVGDMHTREADAEVVESWIAPEPGSMGGQTYEAGTWLMAVKVHSDALWAMVKSGDYSGFSIGGYGTRSPA